MSDDLSGLYSNVSIALTSVAARKINFYAGFWPINAAAFTMVFTEIAKYAMSSKRAGIELRVGELPEGAGAKYDYRDDAYTFKSNNFGTTVLQQATIIHKSVHAWIDLQGYLDSPNEADNEAAAYVTDSLFCFYATGKGSLDLQDASGLTWDVKLIRRVADRIALSLKDAAVGNLSDKDRQNMVDAVIASPVYQRDKITRHTGLWANGITDFRSLPEDYWMRRQGA